ncbi:MAG: hydantoinase B/oxoprolinase family protein, partial [Mariprofundaceae bacterium]|nr:hydantoinase B/oxoprolinase family protein [Mariprofundaceae bacterium]
VFNDPFLGGTHLPDITVVIPIFHRQTLLGFSASRAHHADIGGKSPGSMGVHTMLADEGLVLEPQRWHKAGREQPALVSLLQTHVRNPDERLGDLAAQLAACQTGAKRLAELHAAQSIPEGFAELLTTSEGYGRQAMADLPDGEYGFEDVLEDDGTGSGPLPVRVTLSIAGEKAVADFSGTAAQCDGPMNCPMPVTAAAVLYAFRCLMPKQTPQTAAVFRPITICAPEGSLVNARPGAAVAAGNVETSQRIVDVVLGALAKACPDRIPAAAQGTMNNVVFGGGTGDAGWVYYETVAGGMGAHARGNGLSGVQCHMTNTRNTSIEVLEMHYPLRITRYALRTGSGGVGEHRGGDGLVREWEVLENCSLSLLTERRETAPYGLAGGKPGMPGRNFIFRNEQWEELPAKCIVRMKAGERLRIETPGGGGYGRQDHGEST